MQLRLKFYRAAKRFSQVTVAGERPESRFLYNSETHRPAGRTPYTYRFSSVRQRRGFGWRATRRDIRVFRSSGSSQKGLTNVQPGFCCTEYFDRSRREYNKRTILKPAIRRNFKNMRFIRGFGGRGGARTPGLIVANDALSQLSYTPTARFILTNERRVAKHVSQRVSVERERSRPSNLLASTDGFVAVPHLGASGFHVAQKSLCQHASAFSLTQTNRFLRN